MKYPPGAAIRAPDRPCLAPGFRRWASEYLRDARRINAAEQPYSAFLPVYIGLLAIFFILVLSVAGARAQDGIMANGDLAVTGFSGTRDVGGQAFIDTDGASLKVYDTSGKGSPSAQVVNAPVKFQALARDVGQVFGVALDNAPSPNIYATATSVHGLQIVIPDNNGDGIPERVNTGQPGAMFMDGQFGTALGGGPGTVWRIDGTTGEITKFADITFGGIPNSGPGLGNIAFDPAHFQFYVSDLDTGAVHRLDLSGNIIGVFDHGVDGRQAAGLPAVPMNAGAKMDIESLAFDSTNPDTWGLADAKRRVWGLAYFESRLYYAVAEGSQIWSVGINADGSFAADARVEIESVPGAGTVSDILFTPQGRMVLAQRGGILSAADYTQYHTPKQNSVLRYTRDLDGNWIQEPDEYAIGFPIDHKNASGGVGLACDGTLWSTGDALRNDPAVVTDGQLVVHGLQGNDVNHVRPFNVPPWASWFVDYKDGAGQETEAGHVGDVEVYRNCPGGYRESFPGWYPIPEWTPSYDWSPPVWWPRDPDLDIEKYAHECEFVPGLLDTVECKYTIVVTNFGAADFNGHLNVTDTPDDPNADFIPPAGGSIPWTCSQPGGPGTPIDCVSDNEEHLHPGESEILEITVRITNPDKDKPIRNCAVVDDPFDFWLNEDCDESELPRPDLEIEKTFLSCVPEGANKRCFFVVSIENVGGAPYTGPLQFEENVPAGTIFGGIFGSTTPGWGCIGGAPIKCTLPDPPGVTMNPGDVELVGISVLVPFNGGQTDYENCVDLGSDAHPDDPAAPGVNHSCAPFQVSWPVLKCPAGWTEVTPGNPAGPGDLVIVIDGLFDSIMCKKPKPLEEKAAPMPGPKPDPDPPVKTPPVVHNCPTGWTKAPPHGAPNGWQVMIVDGINPDGSKWGITCMRPKPQEQGDPSCRSGEKEFSSASRVPQGWTWRKVTEGKSTIYCAKPPILLPQPTCRNGEKKFSSLSQVPKGWSRRKVTSGNSTIYCAKPRIVVPQPSCQSGEKTFSSARLVPKGWTSRRVTLGKRTIYCAKPQVLTPRPTCRKGEKTFSSLSQVPKGWSRRKVTLGKYTIWCARPGQVTPVPQVTPQSTPEVKPCPKHWRRVRGNCLPPLIRKVPRKVIPEIRKKPTLQIKPRTQSTPKINKAPLKKKPLLVKPNLQLKQLVPSSQLR